MIADFQLPIANFDRRSVNKLAIGNWKSAINPRLRP
jgi:hypothetical protein